jgi:Sec-independent protein translocase protein TatA
MLAFLNVGPLELVLIAVIAVLIFGKDLPQAASKAYLQARKLRNAVDDLRRETGIERELRNLERTVREAEWEARRMETGPRQPAAQRADDLAARREREPGRAGRGGGSARGTGRAREPGSVRREHDAARDGRHLTKLARGARSLRTAGFFRSSCTASSPASNRLPQSSSPASCSS